MFPASLLKARSPQAEAISALFGQVSILMLVVFLTVAGLVVYSLIRYRAKLNMPEPRQQFGSQPAELVWTVVPLLVVAVLFVATVRTMASVDPPGDPGRVPDLIIIGHQWWWEARYPNGAVTANEIHIPSGRRLRVQIESADVIHDFWVPQLGRKMDAVPGLSSYIWLEADAAGIYPGACAEFCGTQHAWMRLIVVAEPETNFTVWLKHQRGPAGGTAVEGARLFLQKGCGNCHAISGTEATGRSGPDLTHVASRQILGSGTSRNDRTNLAQWIGDPQSAKPGNRMPGVPLSSGEEQGLLTYLETLE